jgi:hypothetical protein
MFGLRVTHDHRALGDEEKERDVGPRRLRWGVEFEEWAAREWVRARIKRRGRPRRDAGTMRKGRRGEEKAGGDGKMRRKQGNDERKLLGRRGEEAADPISSSPPRTRRSRFARKPNI